MKINKLILAPMVLAVGLLSSCDDTVSQLGESIQTPQDKVGSDVHYLQFEASTVSADRLYSSGTTTSLLGEISDPVYGDFRAEFVSQLRTAPEWSLSYEPVSGIDSAVLAIDLRDYVGSTSAQLNLGVYSAPLGYSIERNSVGSLEDVKAQGKLLGSKLYSIDKDFTWVRLSSTDSVRRMTINLGKDFGQRIYELSKSNPEYFMTQEAFNNNVLGGLILSTTTGRGSVVQVVGTSLQLHYGFMQADTLAHARATFISSRTTGHTNSLSSSYIDELLEPNDQYAYIKQPAGVVTQIKLPKEQMNRLMSSVGQVRIGANWTLADTQFKLTVENPSELLLNPPTYMLLLPPDSVQSFFQTEQTELTRSATSYLSSAYSVESRYYNFANIARVITQHLKAHAQWNGSGWTVSKDLDLYMLPVQRTVSSSSSSYSSSEQTASLSEYLFPSFVRLSKASDGLRIGVVSSQFAQ